MKELMMKNHSTRLSTSRHAGMTLVETVIMVGVLALVVGISMPTIGEFITNYRNRMEQRDLLMIQEAMVDFAKTYNRLPNENAANNSYCQAGGNEWYECLARFSQISAERIQNDAWGEERRYIHYETTEQLLETNTTVHYVSLHSKGFDRIAQNTDETGATIAGIDLDGTEFDDSSAGGWWANTGSATARVNAFADLSAGGNDHLLTFSDYAIKLEKYKITRERLKRIAEALASYSSRMYAEEILSGNTNADQLLYAPPSNESTQATSYGMTAVRVRNDVINKQSGLIGTTVSNGDASSAQRQARLNAMTGLMRLLGLPDAYCCNALEKDSSLDADLMQERPFFYYANPRIRTAAGCQNRAASVPFTPSVISMTPLPCG